MNHEKIDNHPEKILKVKQFINEYNCDDIQFSFDQKDWNKFETNNESIALNILHIPHNTKNIKHCYKSKFNSIREHQVTLLMITDGKKCHYLAVKKLSVLLKRITSIHGGDFYCINCLKNLE